MFYSANNSWQRKALMMFAAIAISGCSSIVTTFSDQPVSENATSRSFGERIDDHLLLTKARINIAAEAALNECNIEVYTYEAQIILIGQVQSKQQLAAAEAAVNTLRDARGVKNLLTIRDNISFGRAFKDSLIGTRLKSKLLLNGENSLGNVKAVVENAEVYLYGLATQADTELAVSLARETNGVKTVIKVFSYVD